MVFSFFLFFSSQIIPMLIRVLFSVCSLANHSEREFSYLDWSESAGIAQFYDARMRVGLNTRCRYFKPLWSVF